MGHPTTTRAAVLREHGEDLSIEELPLPAECEPGAAVVRVDCATLCATDVHLWSGAMTFPEMLPIVLGHEMIGTVCAVGPGTRDALGQDVKVGDRIGWSESVCGSCYGCTILRNPVACSQRGYGFLQRADRPPYATGGLAGHNYVTPGALKLVLPDDVKDTWAASAGCAVKTVLHAFERAGGVRPGSTVVVQGAGALGIVATAVASVSGAGKVITIGAPDARRELARRFGADLTIGLDGDADSRVAAVMEATQGRGAELVLDLAGAPGVGAEAIGMAAFGGRFVIVGSTGFQTEPLALGAIMGKQLDVLGSLNGDVGDLYRSIEFLRRFQDRFAWDDLFGQPDGLAGASAALASMSRLEQVKAVINPNR
ncbi:alcohol dehydrogenase [Actinomadura spongiicola]|uniref:Alcohol dehydrogenase n=1 Tax=Actinomadura spongiicola TaxID=2303421 RepID=A0A372GBJ3_9ACTN|nr:zinc-binding dehydrogenase [Actinomadura spongiicola]RFS82512.1 alcohol dehydrogenase [Actinomadura spongiicola]